MADQSVVRIGFSPCPNDTFIFAALVKNLIPLRRKYEAVIEDVETLNQRAFSEELPVSKLSFAAFARLLDYYQLLPVGAALGYDCGPVLVARKEIDLPKARVAVPGRWTTAAFLLSLYSPVGEMVEMRYDQIIPALKEGRVEAGVLIHEARFVYQKEGLFLLEDLGRFWQERTQAPIPLGGIFVSKKAPSSFKRDVCHDIRQSLSYARDNWEEIKPFIQKYAQEMDEEIIERHINTFVNRFTYQLGREGQRAVTLFLEWAAKKGLTSGRHQDFLWEERP